MTVRVAPSGRPLVFLDVDGVLNSDRWFRIRGPSRPDQERIDHAIDPLAMVRLNRLCTATGAAVVVTSTWRLFYPIAELRGHLHRLGLRAPVLGATPDLADQWLVPLGRKAQRGDEILRWMRRHGPVRSLVILDDDADMGLLLRRLVQTSAAVGLTDHDVDRAIAILLGTPARSGGTDSTRPTRPAPSLGSRGRRGANSRHLPKSALLFGATSPSASEPNQRCPT